MAVWIVRAGEGGRNADYAFEQGIISINFGLQQSVFDFVDLPTLRNHMPIPTSSASQLWRFAHECRSATWLCCRADSPAWPEQAR